MTAKLFTIGDSVSQGFMSGAAANTHLCYSTLLAEAIGATNYRYLNWDERYKTKFDMERIFRKLEKRYGSDIRGLEWIGFLPTINSVLDQAEDYFELGDGKLGNAVNSPHTAQGFHNVSVEGMDVADAFMVTPKVCRDEIAQTKPKSLKDNWLKGASHPFYRNAYRVLNPKGKEGESQFDNFSAVDWLKHTCQTEGIENVCLFLGANNALGTVLDLNIVQSQNNGSKPIWEVERRKRLDWNLWHPDHFREEYTELLKRVVAALQHNQHSDWHVFVGTVPLVTIAPLAKGVGEKRIVTNPEDSSKQSLYFQYYTYFPLSLDAAKASKKLLKFEQAVFIDETITEFNKIIRELVEKTNQASDKPRFHIIDTCDSLTQMAWKRNMGKPTYTFPEELKFVYPRPNTKYYHANEDGEVTKGGIFSLDGVHPSATGQGLLAWEFLKKMQIVRPALASSNLDWSKILASDTLRTQPITLMQELYQHDKLIEVVTKICRAVRIKD
ncbi:hypothetical protein TW78_17530 [Vibrio coralliilyticus]|uniref:Uncharacterized protein n=1 Tax=Vibrio coralliilyticus TaxID=190893 RepID=A0A837G5W1_9VIBR|nr:hypothetical protein [Vibrio coralliilyticus]KJY70046.1 hypothetical protein TW78_17530 [Vibrio coralliilyticus]QOU32464.1 hypothetical protein TW71_016560 [Vibrio coralliilyticus]